MTTKQQQAFDDGYKAGYNDDGTKCPYPEDSDEELYWLSGYNSGLDNYSRSFDMGLIWPHKHENIDFMRGYSSICFYQNLQLNGF